MVPLQLDRIASLFSEGIEQTPPSLAERRRRREMLLREGVAARLRRVAAAAGSLGRAGGLGRLLGGIELLVRDILVGARALPDPNAAREPSHGLCGLARRPTASQAMEAYASGLVLHAPIGPVCWFAPPRRWVAEPDARRDIGADTDLRRFGVELELDGDIDEILSAYNRSDLRAARVGFGENLMKIYSDLADRGLVHAVALRGPRGEALAGAFGVAIGRVFVTEGLFGPAELSRAVLGLLDRQLARQNFALHDARFGAQPGEAPGAGFETFRFAPIARAQFAAAANRHLSRLDLQRWRASNAGERRGESLLGLGRRRSTPAAAYPSVLSNPAT